MTRPTDAAGNELTVWVGQPDGTWIEESPDGTTRRVVIRDGQVWPAEEDEA